MDDSGKTVGVIEKVRQEVTSAALRNVFIPTIVENGSTFTKVWKVSFLKKSSGYKNIACLW